MEEIINKYLTKYADLMVDVKKRVDRSFQLLDNARKTNSIMDMEN